MRVPPLENDGSPGADGGGRSLLFRANNVLCFVGLELGSWNHFFGIILFRSPTHVKKGCANFAVTNPW